MTTYLGSKVPYRGTRGTQSRGREKLQTPYRFQTDQLIERNTIGKDKERFCFLPHQLCSVRGQEPSPLLFLLPSDGSSKTQTLTIMPRLKRYKVAGQGLSGETEELIYKKNRILRNYLAWSWASQEPLLFMKRPHWSLAILIRKSDSTVLPCFLNQYIKLFNLKVTCYDSQPALSLFSG